MSPFFVNLLFCSISVENVEHLLKLSDEYQVKLIFDPCIKFVRDQSITKENVMKLLGIAELYGLDDVRQGCNDLLKNMKLKTLSETVHLEDLDLAKTRYFLEQRIKRLETFLDNRLKGSNKMFIPFPRNEIREALLD